MGLGLLGAEHVFEHRVHHRQQAVAHAGDRVGGVQQQLRRCVFGEERVAGHHAVPHQQALEISAHFEAFSLQRRGVIGAADLAQRAGQLVQHLRVQRDRPGAAHALAQLRVGGLERIVPIAVAIGDQGRAFDVALADDGQRALGVLPDSGRVGLGTLRGEEGQRQVEQRSIPAGQQVAGQAQQRPEDHVTVRITGADMALAVEEHEPLRPVAIGVLGREHLGQQLAHGRYFVQCQQHFERALADIARAPAAAGELLQPTWRQEVDQRVVAEPGQHVDQALRGGTVCTTGGGGELRQCGGVQRRGHALHQLALDAQPEVGRRAAADADKGQGAGRRAKQQLRPAHGVKARARLRDQMKAAVGVAGSQVAAGRNTDEHAVLGHRGCDGGRAVIAQQIAGQRDVQAGQHAHRRACQHAQMQAQGMRCVVLAVGGGADHLDQPARVLIDPAAGIGLDLEGRGQTEQLPLAVQLDKQPQAVGAEQAQPAARGGQETVDADMALGHHRMKNTAHPDGGGERRFIGLQMLTAAQQVAVRTLDLQLFGAQHDVRGFELVHAVAGERQQRAVLEFFMPARRAEQRRQRRRVELGRGQQGRAAEQAGGRLVTDQAQQRFRCFGLRQQRIDLRQILVRRRGRMISLHAAEKAQRRALAGGQGQRLVLHGQQRVLVLQTVLAQAVHHTRRQAANAAAQAVELQGVGRKSDTAAQRAQQRPRVAAVLRQVLPRGQHLAGLRVNERAQIEVVADVVLVDAAGAVGRQADVLHADQIDRLGSSGEVVEVHMPVPGSLSDGQAQFEPDVQALPIADGGVAFTAGQQAQGRQRAEQWRRRDGGFAAMQPQPDVRRPAFDRVAGEQVDHQAMRLDAAQSAVGKKGEGQPRRVAEAALAGLESGESCGHVEGCSSAALAEQPGQQLSVVVGWVPGVVADAGIDDEVHLAAAGAQCVDVGLLRGQRHDGVGFAVVGPHRHLERAAGLRGVAIAADRRDGGEVVRVAGGPVPHAVATEAQAGGQHAVGVDAHAGFQQIGQRVQIGRIPVGAGLQLR